MRLHNVALPEIFGDRLLDIRNCSVTFQVLASIGLPKLSIMLYVELQLAYVILRLRNLRRDFDGLR